VTSLSNSVPRRLTSGALIPLADKATNTIFRRMVGVGHADVAVWSGAGSVPWPLVPDACCPLATALGLGRSAPRWR